MLRRESIPDKTILKDINRRLARSGAGSRCKVTATVRGGQVTLNGQVEHEFQRRPVVQTVGRVDGAKGVLDKITVKPRKIW